MSDIDLIFFFMFLNSSLLKEEKLLEEKNPNKIDESDL